MKIEINRSNWLTRRIRKFIVNKYDKHVLGETDEGYYIYLSVNGDLIFFNPKTGDVMTTIT